MNRIKVEAKVNYTVIPTIYTYTVRRDSVAVINKQSI